MHLHKMRLDVTVLFPLSPGNVKQESYWIVDNVLRASFGSSHHPSMHYAITISALQSMEKQSNGWSGIKKPLKSLRITRRFLLGLPKAVSTTSLAPRH